MANEEKEVEALETQFPAIAGSAFAAARDQVLASGQSILETVDGILYEVSPDGRSKPLKQVGPPFRVTSGLSFVIK
jgi:hypothetical protein